jgi:hypothetical protein
MIQNRLNFFFFEILNTQTNQDVGMVLFYFFILFFFSPVCLLLIFNHKCSKRLQKIIFC